MLNPGARATDGSIAAFDAARAAANKLVILTNDASGAHAAIARKHRSRGFAVTAAEIIAGVDILVKHLDASSRYGYLGPEPHPHPQHTQQMPNLSQLTRNFDSLDGFVLLEHSHWGEQVQQRLVDTLQRRPRPVFIGNQDITLQIECWFSIEPGYLALDLFLCGGTAPVLLGKPCAAMYQRVRQHLGNLLAIGDALHTDVLGARNAGMHTWLVKPGLLHGQESMRYIQESGISPHFIAAAI